MIWDSAASAPGESQVQSESSARNNGTMESDVLVLGLGWRLPRAGSQGDTIQVSSNGRSKVIQGADLGSELEKSPGSTTQT